MTWTAVVLVRPELPEGPMVSRLPSFLHPVAGKPLIWHTVRALMAVSPAPDHIYLSGPVELPPEILEGTGADLQPLPVGSDGGPGELTTGGPVILLPASASLPVDAVSLLLEADAGDWVGADDFAAAIRVGKGELERALNMDSPFSPGEGIPEPARQLPCSEAFAVRDREGLAALHRRIRDEIVRALMRGGATFILPESVSVDVDVRIGRDTVVYPGAVIEGQTTIGEETVIGPGCRIIDSWVGSGVELKGWNYIAHTSVRNRAILEPYVRRGFD
ncbi:MAG: hypothetical protein LBG44_03165 [Gemmatimonadota bacterium]|jgi:hypothetical protein|nr:hypothetical protein [Gemmatimonadota bacterium]